MEHEERERILVVDDASQNVEVLTAVLTLAGYEVLSAADLVIITTDHPGVDYARVVERAQRVLDTRNATGALGMSPKVEKL